MRKDFSELVGMEFNCLELDNKMESMGCYSEYEAYTEELLESGCIIYLDKVDGETQTRIDFEISCKNGNDEDIRATYVTITDISR